MDGAFCPRQSSLQGRPNGFLWFLVCLNVTYRGKDVLWLSVPLHCKRIALHGMLHGAMQCVPSTLRLNMIFMVPTTENTDNCD